MSSERESAVDLDAWRRTVTEMQSIASSLEADGWETATIRAGNTAPEPPELGDTGRFGFVFTVPGTEEQAIERVIADADVEEYSVYRRVFDSTAFIVVELVAPDPRRALLIAGAVDTDDAAELESAAMERGEMYTHIRLLDGTELGSVRHDEPAAFFGSTTEDSGGPRS